MLMRFPPITIRLEDGDGILVDSEVPVPEIPAIPINGKLKFIWVGWRCAGACAIVGNTRMRTRRCVC